MSATNNLRPTIPSAYEAMKQAQDTAAAYLAAAIREIDRQLGEGYASQHPELIGPLVQTMAADFHTAVQADNIGHLADGVAGLRWPLEELRSLGRLPETLHDLFAVGGIGLVDVRIEARP